MHEHGQYHQTPQHQGSKINESPQETNKQKLAIAGKTPPPCPLACLTDNLVYNLVYNHDRDTKNYTAEYGFKTQSN